MNAQNQMKLRLMVWFTIALTFFSFQSMYASALIVPGPGHIRNYIEESLCSLGQVDAASIRAKLHQFEERLTKMGVSREIFNCYSIIQQELLCRDVHKTNENDAQLIWHLIVELADPKQVSQGKRNTCALAALQNFLYVHEPSAVCRTVFAARAGKCVTSSGNVVTVPESSRNPDRESSFYRPDGPFRSYASQLFQVAAANTYWQNQEKDPRGMKVKKGTILYQQFDAFKPSAHDSGERLVIDWSDDVNEYVCGENCLPESSPAFSLEAIAKTYAMISGESKSPLVICHRKRQHDKSLRVFGNENELKRILIDAESSAMWPVIVSVNLQSRLFSKNRLLTPGNVGAMPATGKWHVICVNSYDRINNFVTINDFARMPQDKKVAFQDLYESTYPQQSPQAGRAAPWSSPSIGRGGFVIPRM